MPQEIQYDLVIVGGGLAGLTSALHLSSKGVRILLLEKNKYPVHKVCGEYVSNEVVPYLRSLGIDPVQHGAKKIERITLSSRQGKLVRATLPQGGFGMSRYALDQLLYSEAKKSCEVVFKTVSEVSFVGNHFLVTTLCGERYRATYVLGAYGKRSALDKSLERPFMAKPSPWLAVKAHYEASFPDDEVALHTFKGGYCGLSKIESNLVNVCYLVGLEVFRHYRDIATFQKEVLHTNPHLSRFFAEATMRFEKHQTISQISFRKKKSVVNHICMAGDSAGLIHPLCGNGMAMAIKGAQLFSQCLLESGTGPKARARLESTYAKAWNAAFSSRLRAGAVLQRLLLNETAAEYGLRILHSVPSLFPRIISKTHGQAFT